METKDMELWEKAYNWAVAEMLVKYHDEFKAARRRHYRRLKRSPTRLVNMPNSGETGGEIEVKSKKSKKVK